MPSLLIKLLLVSSSLTHTLYPNTSHIDIKSCGPHTMCH